jgi:hypothetical protein
VLVRTLFIQLFWRLLAEKVDQCILPVLPLMFPEK